VYKAELQGATVAMKVPLHFKDGGKDFKDSHQHASGGVFREFRREVLLQSTLSHPNIVTLLGVCTTPHLVYSLHLSAIGRSTEPLTK